jgi:hypothetical protein
MKTTQTIIALTVLASTISVLPYFGDFISCYDIAPR